MAGDLTEAQLDELDAMIAEAPAELGDWDAAGLDFFSAGEPAARFVSAAIATMKCDVPRLVAEVRRLRAASSPVAGERTDHEPPEERRCGEWRINAENLAYGCRLPRGHEGDHHPNACGHDGCEGLTCLRVDLRAADGSWRVTAASVDAARIALLALQAVLPAASLDEARSSGDEGERT